MIRCLESFLTISFYSDLLYNSKQQLSRVQQNSIQTIAEESIHMGKPLTFLCPSETDFAIEWECNPGSSRLFSMALKKDDDVFAVLGIELLCVSSKFIWTDFRRLSWQSGFDATLALKCSPMDANATCLTSQPLKLHQHYMYGKLVESVSHTSAYLKFIYSGSILLVFRLMWF